MSVYVHAFLELANPGYTWDVKVNDAGNLSCQAATPPPKNDINLYLVIYSFYEYKTKANKPREFTRD